MAAFWKNGAIIVRKNAPLAAATIAFVFMISSGRSCLGAESKAVASARSGPAVFCRSQLKYGLDDHYLSRWVDRPLLLDPGLHTANREFAMSFPSYRRMLETVASYGLDGFAFFPEIAGRMGAFLYTDQAAVGGISLLPEFIPDTNLEAKRKVLRAAMDCRSCFRLDGKLLITSYRADTLPPERWAGLLTSLRKELGDVFVFLPDISRPCGEGWAAWIDRFDSDQGVSEADRTRLRKYLATVIPDTKFRTPDIWLKDMIFSS